MNCVWICFVCILVLKYQYCIVHIAPNTWITYDKTYLIHCNLLFMYTNHACMKIIWLCTEIRDTPTHYIICQLHIICWPAAGYTCIQSCYNFEHRLLQGCNNLDNGKLTCVICVYTQARLLVWGGECTCIYVFIV